MASVNYATGGPAPNAKTVGWLNFAGYPVGPNGTVHVVNSIPGGYSIAMDVTNNGTTNNNFNPQGGLTGWMPYGYSGVAGSPGYNMTWGATTFAQMTFSNITVTDAFGNLVKGYSIIAGDGETTVNGEFWNITTNGTPWAWITTLPMGRVVPSTSFVGVGTTRFTEVGSVLNGNAGAVISTTNATALTFTATVLATEVLDLGIVGPFIGVSKTTQPYAAVGNILTYTIPITNYSDQTLTNVVLIDTLPNGVTYQTNSLLINGVNTPAQVPPRISLPDIGLGQTVTVVFKVTVTTIPTPNPMANKGTIQSTYKGNTIGTPTNSAITTVNYAPISMTKSVDQTQALAGSTLTYTVVLKNNGNSTANNVVLIDTIPPSTTFVAGSVTGGTGVPSTGITVGTIPPSGVVTVTFKVAITNPPTSVTLPNNAYERHNFISNNPSTGSTTIANGISNTVTTNVNILNIKGYKSVNPRYASIGDTLVYTITIPNTGTVSANNVVLTDTIATGVSYVPSSAVVNGVPATGTPSTGIQVGTIAPNTVTTITFSVVVTSIPAGSAVPNSATANYNYSLSSGTFNSSANTNTVLTTIVDATLAVTKTVNKAYANVGDTLTYTLSLKFSGNVTASNVVLVDTIPNGTTFIANSVTLNGVTKSGVSPAPPSGYAIGTLTVPAVYTVTFQVLVTTTPVPNPIQNQGSVTYNYQTNTTVVRGTVSNTATTQVNYVTLPTTKNVDKTNATVGDTLTYTIVYQNQGTTTATNVVFKDTIPSGTTFVPNSVTLNGAIQTGATVAPPTGLTIGTIPAGQTVTVTFQVVVNTIPVPNPIPNSGSSTYNYSVDPSVAAGVTGNNTTNTVNTKINTAIVTPTKTVSQATGVVGDTVTYTIVMKNTGNTTANNVVFTDTVPNGTTFVNNSLSVNGTTQVGVNPQTGVTLGSIPVGGVVTVTFVVTLTTVPVPNPTPNTGNANYNYLVDPSLGTTQSAQNSSNTVTTFINPDTTPFKSVDKTSSTVGDTLTYTIVWKNVLNTTETNVTFVDTVPSGTTFITNSVTVNGVTQTGATLSPPSGLNIGTVGPGQTVTLTFQVKVTTIPTPNPIPNNVTTTYTYTTDPSLGATKTRTSPSNTVNTQVNLAQLTNRKSVDKSNAAIGDTLTYTLTFLNTGNSSANSVVITDTIPNGTTFIPDSITVNGVAQPGATIAPPSGLNIGTIPAGQIVTVTFAVTVVTLPTPNPTPNAATSNYFFVVDNSTGAGQKASGHTNIVSTAISDATIVSSKSVSETYGNLGDTLTYTLTINYSGNTTANSVTLIDTIPNGTTFVANSVTLNGVTQTGASPVPPTGYTLGNLATPGIYTVTFKVVVTSIPVPNPIPNQGSISYNYVAGTTLVRSNTTNTVNTQINYVTLPSSKSVDQAYAQVGSTLTYTIVYQNLGTTTATNVVLKDTIPNNTTFVPNSVTVNGVVQPGATVAPPAGFNVGTILAGQTTTVTFQVVVNTIPTPNPMPNSANSSFSYVVNPTTGATATGTVNTGTVTTQINTAIITQTKTASETNAVVGDEVLYTVVMKNTGNTTANNVIFSDTIPNGTSFVPNSLTINGVSQVGANPQTGVNVGNLAVGGVVTITFMVNVIAVPTPNPTPNLSNANYSYFVNPVTGATGTNSTSSNTVNVFINPNTTPLKSVDKTSAAVGDTLTYTLVWQNVLNTTQTNVTFIDTVPSGTTFIPNSVTLNGVTQTGATLNPPEGLNIGTISAGQTVTLTFQVSVATIPSTNPIPNNATTSYGYINDPSLGTTTTRTSPSNTVTTQINTARLVGQKAVDKSNAAIGDTLIYTLTVFNTGNTTAQNVNLVDTIPSGTSFIANSITLNGVTQPGAIITPPTGLSLGNIPPGQGVTITFKVMATSIPVPNPTPNAATSNGSYVVDHTTGVTLPANGNTNVVSTTIADATIVSSKSVNPTYANVGDTLTYTITLNYSGNTMAQSVTVIDTIPNGTTFVANSLTLNGVTQTGASPAPPTGYTLGPLTKPGIYTITFKVIVTTIPVPNPIPNQGSVSYNYIAGTTIVKSDVTNTVNTQINYVTLPSSKTVDKAFAQVGDTLTYTVVYQNLGTTTATNVTLVDSIPNNTTFVPNSVTVNGVIQMGGTVAPPTGFNVGTIPAGQTVTVTFQVVVNTIPIPNPIPNSATSNFGYVVNPATGATATGTVNTGIVKTQVNTAIMTQSKRADETIGIVGDTVTYTIVLQNTGNTTANGVYFTDTVPNGTSFVANSLTVNGVTQVGVNPQTGVNLGNIPVGGVDTVSFMVTIDTVPVPNPTPNTSNATYNYLVDPSLGTSGLGATSSNTVGTYVNPVTNPLKIVIPTSATVGDTLTYYIVWQNVLNVTQTNVHFTDTIPSGTTFVPNSITLNGVTQPGAIITPPSGFNIGSMPSGEVVTITFQVVVNTVPVPNPIPNRYHVTYTYVTDPSLGTTKTVTVPSNTVNTQINLAQLSVMKKSVSQPIAAIGETLTYTIGLYNNGNTTANNVIFTDTIPGGTTFVTNSVRINGVNQPSGVVVPPTGLTVGDIPVGGTTTITFEVQVVSVPTPNPTPNTGTLGYDFVVDDTTGATRTSGGNTNVVSTTIVDATIVSAKRVNKAYANVGDTLTYTVTISYKGNTTAQSVVLVDTIPNGTTFVPNSITLNGVTQPGVSPAPPSGYTLGNLTVPGIYTVTFQVIINTIPVPNPIPNEASVSYNYVADTTLIRSTSTNTVNTLINYVTLPSSKSVDKAYVAVGDTVTYTIVYQNIGTTTATNVVLKDTIPNNTTLVPNSVTLNGVTQPGVTVAPPTGFDVGTIPAGQTVTVTFEVVVVTIPVPNPIPNTASSTYSYVVDPSLGIISTGASQTNKVNTQVNTASILMTKTTSQTEGIIGDTVTYTVAIKNTGNITANNVVFTDTFPNGTSFVPNSLTVNNVPQPGTDPQKGINVGNIAVGAVVTVSFVVTLTTVPIPNPTPNTGVANYNYFVDPSLGSDHFAQDRSNTVTTFINPDVKPTKAVDQTSSSIGDTLTYTLVWQNLTNETQTNVIFVDTVPSGTTLIANSVTLNGVTQPGATLNPPTGFNGGSVGPGQTLTVTFQVRVTTIPTTNPIPNDATVNYTYITDPSLGTIQTRTSPSNTVSTQINLAQLGNQKSVSQSVAAIGDTLTYTLVVNNTGNVAATHVVLSDTIPNGTTFIPNSITLNGVSQPGATITPPTGFNVGTIPAGQVATITFEVMVNAVPTPNPTPNSATNNYSFVVDPVTGKTINSGGNTNVVSTTIVDATIVSSKRVNKAYANVGDTLTYTVTIGYKGNATAQSVTLVDTIPNGTSFVANSITLNGVTQPGANPSPPTGYTIGSLTVPGVYTVTFQVVVTTIPVPNPIPNEGSVSYNYVATTTLIKSTSTNTVNTLINYVTLPSSKSVDKPYAAVGDTLTYTLVYQNLGTTTATNVILKDTIPNNTTLVPNSVTVNGVVQPGKTVAPPTGLNVGTIPAGQVATVTFEVVVTTIPVPNPIPNTGSSTYSYVVDPSLGTTSAGKSNTNTVNTQINTAKVQMTKTTSQTEGVVGDTVTYTVVLKNTGNITASNAIFTDTLPNGTAFVPNSLSVNNIVQPGTNPQTGVNVGDIPVGGVVTVSFVVTLTPVPVPNPAPNTGGVNYNYLVDPSLGTTQNAQNSSNTVTTFINPDTTPSKRVNLTSSTVGDTLVYTINWTNVMNETQTNVTFMDTVPSGTSFIPNSVMVNGVNQSGATLSPPTGLNIGSVGPGQTVTIVFWVKVTTIPTPNPIPNDVTTSYTYLTDPSLGTTNTRTSPSNTVTTQVNLAQLGSQKAVSQSIAAIGDTLMYTLNIFNTGNSDAGNVIITDTIPRGTTFVPDSITLNGVSQAGAVIAPPTGLNVGTIPAGQSITITFEVTVASIPIPNPTPNSANTKYAFVLDTLTGSQINSSTNTNVVKTTIVDATIATSKSVNKAYASVGDTLTYTVTLNYQGNTTAQSVTLVDTIPNGTTLVANSVTLNGVTQPGVDPSPPTGYTIGALTASGNYVVTFQVVVTTIPVPNPIPNQGSVSYNYVASTTLIRSTSTNTVNTLINYVTLPSSKSVNQDFATVGDTLTYTIVYQNLGTTTATDVVLKDTIPSGTTFVADSVTLDGIVQQGATVAPPLGFNVGTIPAGQTTTITFEVVVNTIPVSNPIPNTGRSTFSYVVDPSLGISNKGTSTTNTVETQVNTANLVMRKNTTQTVGVTGDTVTYTVALMNTGNTTASNVSFNDTIPNGTTFVGNSLQVNGVAQPGANPQNGVNVGDLAAGGVVTVSFVVTLTSVPVPNPTPNTGEANYSYLVDPTLGIAKPAQNSSNTVTIFINPDTIPFKSVNQTSATVGDTLTYTMVWTNLMNETQTNVTFIDTVPSGTTFVPNSVRVNGVTQTGANLNPPSGLNIGSVGAGQTVTLTFQVVVNTIPTPNPIPNDVTASYTYMIDPSVGTTHTRTAPSDTVTTQINLAHLTATKETDTSIATLGDTITYTINLFNTGNTTANNVTIGDTIPTGTSFVTDSIRVDGVTQPGATIAPPQAVSIGNIAPGQSVTITFEVVATSIPIPNPTPNAAASNYTFVVDASTGNSRFSSSNTNVVSTRIIDATIASGKAVDKAFANIGDTLTYTATLTYSGNTTAENVRFIDTIPNGTVLVPNSLTLNGVTQPGADPSPPTGYSIGALTLPAVYTITFQVIVMTIPIPNPIPNQGSVSYDYVASTTVTRTTDTNTVNTLINYVTLPSTKSVDKTFAKVGDTLTYTIVYQNLGTTTANDVRLIDTIPIGTTFVPNSVTVDGVTQPGGIVSPPTGLAVGTIPAGQVTTVAYQVVVSTIPNPNPIPNTAESSFDYVVDPNLGIVGNGNSATNTVTTQVNTAIVTSIKDTSETVGIVGDIITYTIAVQNTGNTTAQNVIFTDTIPNGTTFVSDSLTENGVPQPGADPQAGVDLGDLSVGETVTITFRVVATTIPTPNPILNTSLATYSYVLDTTLGTTVPAAKSSNTVGTFINPKSNPQKLVNTVSTTVGDTLTYTLVGKNTLTDTITNVIFVDTIPSGTVFVPNSVTVDRVPQPGATMTLPNGLNLGSIGPGETVTVTFQVVVTTIPVPNPIPNEGDLTYTYISDPTLGTTTTKTVPSNVVNTQINVAELSAVGKSVDKAYASVGETLDYTITLGNSGNVTAINVILIDTIPNGTSFVANSVSINGINQLGAVVEPPTGLLLDSIPAGQTVTIDFVVIVDTIPIPNPIPNTGNITYDFILDDTTGAVQSNAANTNTVFTQVNDASLAMSKSVNPEYGVVGDTLVYTIVLNCTGNTTMDNVVIIDSLPSSIAFVPNSVTLNGTGILGVNPSPPIGYSMGSLPVPGIYTVTFEAIISTIPSPNPIVNDASGTFNFTKDPSIPDGEARANQTNQVATTVNMAVLTGITKSVDKAYADCGDTVGYTIAIPNTGTAPAVNIIFQDTIPNQTLFVPNSVTVNGSPQVGSDPQTGILISSIAPNTTTTITFQVLVTC